MNSEVKGISMVDQELGVMTFEGFENSGSVAPVVEKKFEISEIKVSEVTYSKNVIPIWLKAFEEPELVSVTFSNCEFKDITLQGLGNLIRVEG